MFFKIHGCINISAPFIDYLIGGLTSIILPLFYSSPLSLSCKMNDERHETTTNKEQIESLLCPFFTTTPRLLTVPCHDGTHPILTVVMGFVSQGVWSLMFDPGRLYLYLGWPVREVRLTVNLDKGTHRSIQRNLNGILSNGNKWVISMGRVFINVKENLRHQDKQSSSH